MVTDPALADELIDTLRTWVRKEVLPVASDYEHADEFPEPLVAQMREMGLFGATIPVEYGGLDLDTLTYARVVEELAFGWMSLSGVLNTHMIGSNLIKRFGTDEQKQRWLKPLVNGDIRSCFSMTEPEVAGSDPRLLRATAKRDGDYYVINAHKWFSSGAHGSSFAIIMAMTNPEQENPYLRFSQIIVPTDTPGFKIARGIPVMGEYDNHHAEIWYEDCRVPVTNRLGGEGMGFAIAQERLGPGRIHHCMRWLGVAQRAFELMCEYATQREMFGSTLARKANIQDWIAEARADIQAARLMTLHAAWKIDTQGQQGAREEISLIKFFGAKVLHSVVDKAIQVFGAAGVTEDHPLSMFYRQARFARIYDGPDEVHKMVVARRILAQYEGKRS